MDSWNNKVTPFSCGPAKKNWLLRGPAGGKAFARFNLYSKVTQWNLTLQPIKRLSKNKAMTGKRKNYIQPSAKKKLAEILEHRVFIVVFDQSPGPSILCRSQIRFLLYQAFQSLNLYIFLSPLLRYFWIGDLVTPCEKPHHIDHQNKEKCQWRSSVFVVYFIDFLSPLDYE